MIDQGLLLDFRTPSTYINGIIAARIRLCANNGTCWVLKDRMAKSMTKYGVAIFDETGKSELDVLLMGNTLYVLGVRLAEDKWFISKNQPKEFGGSMSHVAKTMEFQCGYGARLT